MPLPFRSLQHHDNDNHIHRIEKMFGKNIGLRGGPAPVLTMSVDISGVPAGYTTMDKRKTIKVMVQP